MLPSTEINEGVSPSQDQSLSYVLNVLVTYRVPTAQGKQGNEKKDSQFKKKKKRELGKFYCLPKHREFCVLKS